MIRVLTYPLPIFKSMSNKAKKVETDLREVFKSQRFDMTQMRAYYKLAVFIFLAFAFKIAFDEYNLDGNINIGVGLFILSFVIKFDTKIGISNDVWRRQGEILDNIESGKTEWHRLNVWQILGAIFLTSFKNNPLQTILILCCVFCILYWILGGGISII